MRDLVDRVLGNIHVRRHWRAEFAQRVLDEVPA